MQINLSSSSSSFAAALLSSSNSSSSFLIQCFRSRINVYLFSALTAINLLLSPLFVHIFYLSYQQWKKQCSTSSCYDVFTHHSIVMQLKEVLGYAIFSCGNFINLPNVILVGLSVLFVTSLGKALFHPLTCVERYLAVVHPVTYLGLRQGGGVRIKNISAACVWLLSFGWTVAVLLCQYGDLRVMYFAGLSVVLTVICFCSFSVLHVLQRSGPGEASGNRKPVDKSKLRAFHTLMAITGVLIFKFVGNLLINVINVSFGFNSMCTMVLVTFWSDLPGNLVLPVLFLHRTGKLPCCKPNAEPG